MHGEETQKHIPCWVTSEQLLIDLVWTGGWLPHSGSHMHHVTIRTDCTCRLQVPYARDQTAEVQQQQQQLLGKQHKFLMKQQQPSVFKPATWQSTALQSLFMARNVAEHSPADKTCLEISSL